MNRPTDQCRDAFEKWVKSQSFYELSLERGNGRENGYWESDTEMAFTVWQAALESKK